MIDVEVAFDAVGVLGQKHGGSAQTMAMRIAIIGSRGFPAPDLVEAYVGSLPEDTIVVSGGAQGVDGWAEQAARKRGLEVLIFHADWRNLGSKAGPIRNAEIVANSDQVTAFWDRKSRGTLNTLVVANEAKLPMKIFDPHGNEVPTDVAMQAAHELGVVASIEKARRKAQGDG